MIYWITDNIISPLGFTSLQNYEAVKAGQTALCRYDGKWDIPESFTASFLSNEQNLQLTTDGFTRFEAIAYQSARNAIAKSGIDVSDQRVVFILSTTKGNTDNHSPADAASHIACRLGITTQPIVVCNACISGVAAIILAKRLLEANLFDYAIVCGADIQTKFTVSGFLSLKAVSAEPCRPFDMERTGLNLGEAAATIIFTNKPCESHWAVTTGAITNDAFHTTSPSKNGEGAFQALQNLHADPDNLAFINAHGTATMFNDQMESVAIERAGLNSIPVNSLKGFFGHTLGAAGILEAIISQRAADEGIILGTKGFEERGVSGKINITEKNTPTKKHDFIKMISGFGGCNAAILVTQHPSPALPEGERETSPKEREPRAVDFSSPRGRWGGVAHSVNITPDKASIDGQPINCKLSGKDMLTELYRRYVGNYAKYYKMDPLCRLGFIASELLLRKEVSCGTDTSVILFNRSSSVKTDIAYENTIGNGDGYFPNPATFIYTLPNIVTGEIAIRNGWYGETSFYILPHRDDRLIKDIVAASFAENYSRHIIYGWIDYPADDNFETELHII